MKISQALSYALLVSATSAYKLHFFLGSQCNGQILDDLTNDEINDEPKCSTRGITGLNTQSVMVEKESGDSGQGFQFYLDKECHEPYETTPEGCVDINGFEGGAMSWDMMYLIQMAEIAGAMTLGFITLVVVVHVIYLAGASLGYPCGRFISQCLPNFAPNACTELPHDPNSSQPAPNARDELLNDANPPSCVSFSHRSIQEKNAIIIGAMVAFFFFFAALMTEAYLEGLKDISGEADGWDFWRAYWVLIRACVECLLILVMLRGAGYIGQKIRNSLDL